MAAVLALLGTVIGYLVDLLGIATMLQGLAAKAAQEHNPYQIEATVTATSLNVANPTYGLAALHADLAAAITTINAHTTAALDGLNVIATVPDQPSWYTAPTAGPDEDTIAYAVWYYESSGFRLDGSSMNLSMNQVVAAAAARALSDMAWVGIPLPANPWIALCVGYTDFYGPSGWSWGSLSTTGQPAYPDFASWVAGDTPYTFLARTQPSFGWSLTGPDGLNDGHTAWYHFPGTTYNRPWYKSAFTEFDVGVLPAVSTPPTVTLPPMQPVYPGPDGVTFGDAASLDDQLHLTGAMDGVMIAVTTPPSRVGQYAIGGVILDYGVGRIAFETDDGYIEPWQYLGFRSAIYTPKTMAHAGGVRLQVLGGAAGTITPWSVS